MEKKGKTKPNVIDFSKKYSKHLKGLSSAKTPDLEIHIKSEILKVHKIILTSGNDVFKAMLASQMKESQKNRLEITDCDPAAFKAFLAHLYTSHVHRKDISLDLLMIADKYLDLPLKNSCFKKLGREISMANIVKTAEVATQCNFGELITACQKFVTKNYARLIGTPQLEAIIKNESLVAGIFKEYDALLVEWKKTYKFFLEGVDLLLEDECEFCEAPESQCECDDVSYDEIHNRKRPPIPWITFCEGNVKWTLGATTKDNDDEVIGIKLSAKDKDVRADIRLTVTSQDPNTRNIVFEKKNEAFGVQFLTVFRNREKYDKDVAYIVNGGFSVELLINVLSAKEKKKSFF